MDAKQIRASGEQLLSGQLSLEQFVAQVQETARGSAELSDTTLDLDRQQRCGFPEVVFGEGKSAADLIEIFERLIAARQPALATRVAADKAAALAERFGDAGRYNEAGRTYRVDGAGAVASPRLKSRVAVVTAGTSDRPVAEEAAETLDWMGVEVLRVRDVGVAGPHRLLPHVPALQQCAAVVVAAGMEGALPSVVGGHVSCPVFAVPTSVGYGASFGGLAALLGMLNSCAANVAVVNIDAGFKAGYLAGLVAAQAERSPTPPTRE